MLSTVNKHMQARKVKKKQEKEKAVITHNTFFASSPFDRGLTNTIN